MELPFVGDAINSFYCGFLSIVATSPTGLVQNQNMSSLIEG